jgi:hypothetical protein
MLEAVGARGRTDLEACTGTKSWAVISWSVCGHLPVACTCSKAWDCGHVTVNISESYFKRTQHAVTFAHADTGSRGARSKSKKFNPQRQSPVTHTWYLEVFLDETLFIQMARLDRHHRLLWYFARNGALHCRKRPPVENTRRRPGQRCAHPKKKIKKNQCPRNYR